MKSGYIIHRILCFLDFYHVPEFFEIPASEFFCSQWGYRCSYCGKIMELFSRRDGPPIPWL